MRSAWVAVGLNINQGTTIGRPQHRKRWRCGTKDRFTLEACRNRFTSAERSSEGGTLSDGVSAGGGRLSSARRFLRAPFLFSQKAHLGSTFLRQDGLGSAIVVEKKNGRSSHGKGGSSPEAKLPQRSVNMHRSIACDDTCAVVSDVKVNDDARLCQPGEGLPTQTARCGSRPRIQW